jgi:Flp pilus assembly protein TadG
MLHNGQDRGAALVEAALVIPILLLLTFGIWTTARAWNIQNTMEHAAREAARFGATEEPWDAGTSPGAVRDVADADMASAAIDTTAIDTVCIELIADTGVSCDGTHTNDTGTEQVFVKLQYPDYRLQFLFFSTTIDMEATAISRHESAP